MAFIAGNSFVNGKVARSSTCARQTKVVRSRVQMSEETKTEEKNKQQTGEELMTGFVPFAEKLNGRAAMFGFAVALLTETINQDHPTIVQQLVTTIAGQ